MTRLRTDRHRTLSRTDFDVVVVGSGLGGLTAAALLARRGRSVLVLDQHYVAGGNLTSFRRPRYEFDIGLHYVGGCHPGGTIPRILEAAGAEGIVFEEMDPDGFDTLIFPDFTFRIPRGIDAFRARLLEHFPAEKRGIDRYIRLLRQLDIFTWGAGRRLATLAALPRCLMLLRWAGRTLGDFLDSCTRDARLKAVLAGQHGDYGAPPSRASVVIGGALPLHYLHGAWVPRGGGQAISDALAASIERNGGKILLMSRVRRIEVQRGRVQAVHFRSHHLGDVRVTTRAVISNADLKRTLLDLVGEEHLSRRTAERVRRYRMSAALAVAYLGIRRDLVSEGHPRTNYWVHGGYDHEAPYRDIAAGRFPEQPFAYVSLTSVKDPTNRRLAPPGITNLQVMTPRPLRAGGLRGHRGGAPERRLPQGAALPARQRGPGGEDARRRRAGDPRHLETGRLPRGGDAPDP